MVVDLYIFHQSVTFLFEADNKLHNELYFGPVCICRVTV